MNKIFRYTRSGTKEEEKNIIVIIILIYYFLKKSIKISHIS